MKAADLAIPVFAGATVRTIREGIETIEKQGETMTVTAPRKRGGQPGNQNRAKRRGRPPLAAQAEPKKRGRPKGSGKNGAALNGSYAVLLASLRAEREKLIDKVAAIGTAIEALEAA